MLYIHRFVVISTIRTAVCLKRSAYVIELRLLSASLHICSVYANGCARVGSVRPGDAQNCFDCNYSAQQLNLCSRQTFLIKA